MSEAPGVRVSVVTIAYNQERYIAEAVESVLAQVCDFGFEYIICEDCSTDGTPSILEEYARLHPDVIRLTLRRKNVGAHANLADALNQCRGEYVAILDGDDYWTSPEKLQKQVAFMDAHPDCALSFHGVRAIDENGEPYDLEFCATRPERSVIEDLIKENFISTCTVMYRWGLVESLPEWWDKTWVSDYSLHVLHADHGWIGFIDECMAAYRVHGEGMWSGERAAARMKEFIKTLWLLDESLDYRYHDAIEWSANSHKYHLYHEFAVAYDSIPKLLARGDRAGARSRARWMLRNLKKRDALPLNAIAVQVLRASMPGLIRPALALKGFIRGFAGGKRTEEPR